AAFPRLACSTDTDTGLYFAGSDVLGLATGGTQRVLIGSSGDMSVSGTFTSYGESTFIGTSTTTVPLSAKMVPSQTSDVFQIRDATDVAKIRAVPNGTAVDWRVTGSIVCSN